MIDTAGIGKNKNTTYEMNGNPSFVNLIRSNTIRIYARKYDTNYIEREYIGDGGRQ